MSTEPKNEEIDAVVETKEEENTVPAATEKPDPSEQPEAVEDSPEAQTLEPPVVVEGHCGEEASSDSSDSDSSDSDSSDSDSSDSDSSDSDSSSDSSEDLVEGDPLQQLQAMLKSLSKEVKGLRKSMKKLKKKHKKLEKKIKKSKKKSH